MKTIVRLLSMAVAKAPAIIVVAVVGVTVVLGLYIPQQEEAGTIEAFAPDSPEWLALETIIDEFAGADSYATAKALAKAISGEEYDLILCGKQAVDDDCAQVGPLVAAMLDVPCVNMVTALEVGDGSVKGTREIEGGNQEMNLIDLPCVLSIQTGINEPRYVGIRGIRKVASVEIPRKGAGDLGLDSADVGTAAAKVKRVDCFVPDLGEGAEMLEGSTEEVIAQLIELLKAKGGLK